MTESALTTTPASSVYKNEGSFELHQRMAKSLCQSNLVPQQYQGQGGLSNCLVALEMANRMNISPLVVMQNMNVIQGKPSWSAQFIIATITGCGRYENFDYEMVGEKEDLKIRCTAKRIKDGKEIYGSWVSIAMARAENWIKNPKWKSMPEHMLKWRAATFFGRQHVADLLLGIQTEDEIVDIQPMNITPEVKTKIETVKEPSSACPMPNTPHEAAIATSEAVEKPKEVHDGFEGF
tara:strand:- start:2675 stop:3382 length:708 start_codon:yes stop_codon:yes gene_type:complete